MSETNMSENDDTRDLSEGLDWRAGRTWVVFGGFALILGVSSGAIIVASDVIGQLVVRGDRFGFVALVLSVAVHIGALPLLSRAIPLRDGAGIVVQGYRMLGNPPPDVLPSFWRYGAWILAVSLVAVILARYQPFFTLSAEVGLQGAVPVIFAPWAAQFPASVLVARSRAAPPRNRSDTAANGER